MGENSRPDICKRMGGYEILRMVMNGVIALFSEVVTLKKRVLVLTGSGGEHGLIVQQVLYPSHHVVDVRWRRELNTLPILVDPCVVQSDR